MTTYYYFIHSPYELTRATIIWHVRVPGTDAGRKQLAFLNSLKAVKDFYFSARTVESGDFIHKVTRQFVDPKEYDPFLLRHATIDARDLVRHIRNNTLDQLQARAT